MRARTLGVAASSVAGHLVVGMALFAAWGKPPPEPYEPRPITVALVTLPPTPPAPAPAPPAAAESAPAASQTQHAIARTIAAPARAVERPAVTSATASRDAGLSDAALVGAATSAGGDGGCNMARRLEDDLRGDPLVQTAVASFSGRAIMVWNGDWLWIDGEDGKGLTAVRQAMMWDIAFAPSACKAQTMHGLVIIAANRGHGARLVVGGGAWRWSDLLVPHPGVGN
jgi:hypothetical protein